MTPVGKGVGTGESGGWLRPWTLVWPVVSFVLNIKYLYILLCVLF
jgi:hypothetical protein